MICWNRGDIEIDMAGGKQLYAVRFDSLADLLDYRIKSGIRWKSMDETNSYIVVTLTEQEVEEVQNEFKVVVTHLPGTTENQ